MPLYELPNGRRRWTYIVYVVELDPKACAEHSAPCNGGPCGKPPVYVGQTALTAEERLANHRRGHGRNILVQRHARRLAAELAPDQEYETRTEAEAVEAHLAEELRREGYCVSGGH